MNKLTIIGNLTRDPELRTTTSGISVCSFTVAVNRKRQQDKEPEADYFRVTAWRERGEICAKYLQKGKKVCVIGPVSVSVNTSNTNGKTYANLEVTAEEVEFLSGRQEAPEQAPEPVRDQQTGMEQVEMDTSDLPF